MTKITAGHKLYAVCMRNHAYYIVGPFESYETLEAWGEREETHGGDPRWQSIELSDGGSLLPEVHGPDWHPGAGKLGGIDDPRPRAHQGDTRPLARG